MSVRKFRSVYDMPGPPVLRPLDPDNLRIACELTELAFGLHPWRLKSGVHKFRSVEERSVRTGGRATCDDHDDGPKQ